jgi:hypothetical protein
MTLEQRLEKVERENRWMRRIGAVCVAVAIAAAGVFLFDRLTPGHVEVRALTVVNPFGRRIADLRWDSLGGSLELYSNGGKVIWKAPKD